MRIEMEEKIAYLFGCIAKLKSLKVLKIEFHGCSGVSNITISNLGKNLVYLKSLEGLSIAFLSRSPFGINLATRISNYGIKEFAKHLSRLRTLKQLMFGLESSGRLDTGEGIQRLLSSIAELKYLKKLKFEAERG